MNWFSDWGNVVTLFIIVWAILFASAGEMRGGKGPLGLPARLGVGLLLAAVPLLPLRAFFGSLRSSPTPEEATIRRKLLVMNGSYLLALFLLFLWVLVSRLHS